MRFAHKLQVGWYVSVFMVCVFVVWSLSTETLKSDVDLLYTRRYALMSYLSIMGIEGIAQSTFFVQGAQRLAQSWIRHVPATGRMQYDMVLLVTDPYGLLNAKSVVLLRDVGWILIKVDPLYGIPSASAYLFQNHYSHTAQFTKLHMWTFERYEHILYLDSDMLVMKDILSTVSNFYNNTSDKLGVARNRARDDSFNADGSYTFNAGLMYITPSRKEFVKMSKAALYTEYDVLLQEQAFLQVYWANRTFLMPSALNQFVDGLMADCMVMHFISTLKPWFICPFFSGHEDACNEWDSYRLKRTL